VDTEITLQRLPQYGLAAHTNSADAHRALEMLGFTRTGRDRPHLLAVPLDRQVDVAEDCARLLATAEYTVRTDEQLAPGLTPSGRSRNATAPQDLDTDPTVAVTRHPVLGVVVTTATPGSGESHADITGAGFHHVPHLGMYILPFGTPLDYALHAVDQLSARLTAVHTPISINPDVQHPVPGQGLTSRQPATPTAAAPKSPAARLVTRLERMFDRVGDAVARAFRPQQHPRPLPEAPPAQPAAPGTAWVQIPARTPAFHWSPPTSLPEAAGVSVRAVVARAASNEAAGRVWWDDGIYAAPAKSAAAPAPTKGPRR
jgi:hypothetical protein